MNNGINIERGWLSPGQGRAATIPWVWLRALASLRVTLAAFLLLGAGLILTLYVSVSAIWAIMVPLAFCAVNLMAALAVHPALRRHADLLVFHMALLAILLLAALGRLTYLKGHMELSTGEWFSGKLAGYEAGPWHPWGIDEVRFANTGFAIDYEPGRRRDHTFNTVRFLNSDGHPQEVVIGDQVPLVLNGYRFYTSFNKGFALAFVWTPANGAPQRGTVHLPAYPIHEYRQANTWTPPGGTGELWVQLRFDETLLDRNGPAQFRTPGAHTVVVREENRRMEMIPGQSVSINGGRLTYEGVGTWMGYTIFYDRTIPWLLAAGVVGVLSLGWHFWRRYASRSWMVDRPPEGEES